MEYGFQKAPIGFPPAASTGMGIPNHFIASKKNSKFGQRDPLRPRLERNILTDGQIKGGKLDWTGPIVPRKESGGIPHLVAKSVEGEVYVSDFLSVSVLFLS